MGRRASLLLMLVVPLLFEVTQHICSSLRCLSAGLAEQTLTVLSFPVQSMVLPATANTCVLGQNIKLKLEENWIGPVI